MSNKRGSAAPPERLELREYVPFFITAIANRWTSTSSRSYLRRFGIGIVEWRVLASLGAQGEASSLDVVNLVGVDPASVSKAIRNLEGRGLVTPVIGRFPGRTKPYRMTQAGDELFEAIRVLAVEREDLLLDTLSSQEREEFVGLLSKVHAGLHRLTDLD